MPTAQRSRTEKDKETVTPLTYEQLVEQVEQAKKQATDQHNELNGKFVAFEQRTTRDITSLGKDVEQAESVITALSTRLQETDARTKSTAEHVDKIDTKVRNLSDEITTAPKGITQSELESAVGKQVQETFSTHEKLMTDAKVKELVKETAMNDAQVRGIARRETELALEDAGVKVQEAIEGSAPVRFFKHTGRQIKRSVPTTPEQLQMLVVTDMLLLGTARYVPFMRNGIARVITRTV